MKSLGFKFHLYTDSFQIPITDLTSVLKSRQLEVYLIGILNIICPKLLTIPPVQTCSFYNLSPISFPRNDPRKHFGMCLSRLMWVCVYFSQPLMITVSIYYFLFFHVLYSPKEYLRVYIYKVWQK